MKFLSIKESLAITEIIVASLCMYNFSLIDFFDEKFIDINLFIHRCVCVILGFVCFFNALGTWFWFSSVKITKMLHRVHKVLVYIILNILLISTHFLYTSKYCPLVWGYFDQNIFFDEVERIRISFYIIIVILILSGTIIVINVIVIGIRVKRLLKKKNRNYVK